MINKKLQLLVVDDNEFVRDLICLTFADEPDIEIAQAINGDEAWQQCQAHRFDIVLSDVMMPGDIDGIELCRRIKSSENPCFVVLISAKNQQSDIDLGLQAGADKYKVKPISPLELLKLVNDSRNKLS